MTDKVRQPKQKRAIENKTLLLGAAKKLFTEKGYLNTSSNEIVKEAGVSIGTFYAYYKDKKAVFMDLLEEYSNDYYKKLEQALGSISRNDIKIHVRAIIQATMDISKAYTGFEDELRSMQYIDKDIKQYSERKHTCIISKIKEMLVRLKISKKDPDVTAFLFFCLVDNFSFRILHQDSMDIEAAIEQCVDMMYSYSCLAN